MPEKYRLPAHHERRQIIERMERAWVAEKESLEVVRKFNGWLAANQTPWSWPTVGAALTSKHHWLVVSCDSCGTILDLDLRMKRRDQTAPVRIALDDVRCVRCNGHGRTRIVGLSLGPSI